MGKLAANTYGEALFSLAMEENKVDALYQEAKVVIQALEENTDFVKLLTHPQITKELTHSDACHLLYTPVKLDAAQTDIIRKCLYIEIRIAKSAVYAGHDPLHESSVITLELDRFQDTLLFLRTAELAAHASSVGNQGSGDGHKFFDIERLVQVSVCAMLIS